MSKLIKKAADLYNSAVKKVVKKTEQTKLEVTVVEKNAKYEYGILKAVAKAEGVYVSLWLKKGKENKWYSSFTEGKHYVDRAGNDRYDGKNFTYYEGTVVKPQLYAALRTPLHNPTVTTIQ